MNYSLECIGSAKVLRQCVDALAPLGVAGLVGGVSPDAEVRLNMLQIFSGRMVRGIVEGDAVPELFIPILVEQYNLGRFAFDRLVTYYDFMDINQAAEDMEAGRGD